MLVTVEEFLIYLNKKYARPDSGREGEGTTRLSNHAIMGDSTSPSTTSDGKLVKGFAWLTLCINHLK